MSEERAAIKDGDRISYLLTRKRMKSITIRVKEDGTVRVSAPIRTPVRTVDEVVLKNAARIRGALSRIPPPPPPFGEGSTVFYLGERYVLNVTRGKSELSFSDGVAHLSVSARTKDLVGAYAKACRSLFLALIHERCERFEACYATFAGKRKEIRVRDMKGVWGNCRPDTGVLTFSTHLLRFPIPLIDSVVAHEYTHFFYRGHGDAFYRALLRVCPDYRQKKKELEDQNSKQKREQPV